MNAKQEAIHRRALKFSRQIENVEMNLVRIFQEIRAENVHREFKCKSVFEYALNILGHSRSQAYALDQLARKSREIPALGQAIFSGKLRVSNASRLLSTITKDNAAEYIAFAQTHTCDEVNQFVLGKSPKAKYRNSVKLVAGNLMKVVMYIPVSEYESVERLHAIKGRGSKDVDQTFLEGVHLNLDKCDPLRKAERAQKRQDKKPAQKKKVCTIRQKPPVTAAQKHQTILRTKGRCVFVDAEGERCNDERWTETHHVIQRSHGGGNEPENLTTLCWYHHDLVHQMTFPGLEPNWTLDPCT